MYGFKIVSFLLALCSYGYALTPEKQIVSGEDATDCEFPHMVFIETFFEGSNSWCGATLVDRKHVLTAGHCLSAKPIGITAHFGSIDRYRPTTSIKVSKWTTHPKYQRAGGTIVYDVAILTLSKQVQFTKCIKPLALPAASETFTGPCTVAGWGKLSHEGVFPQILQRADIDIIPFDRCHRRFYNTKAEQHICVGSGQKNDNNICNGDSGGPLICNGKKGKVLAGIASYGYNCDFSFAIFAKVSTYLDFINSHRWG